MKHQNHTNKQANCSRKEAWKYQRQSAAWCCLCCFESFPTTLLTCTKLFQTRLLHFAIFYITLLYRCAKRDRHNFSQFHSLNSRASKFICDLVHVWGWVEGKLSKQNNTNSHKNKMEYFENFSKYKHRMSRDSSRKISK